MSTKYASRVVLKMTDVVGEYIVVEKVEHDYTGTWALACGPSSQEEALQASSANFSSALQQDFGTRFQNQNDVLAKLNASLSPIVAAGPSQHGFAAPELSALQTQAINQSGAAARNAGQAARNFSAGQGGGGTSGLTSGIDKQIQASVASDAANKLATTQNQITAADFGTGRENYWRAQGGLSALGSQYDPAQFGNMAITSNQNSFGQADKINQEKNQKAAAIAGIVSSLGMDVASFGAGALGGGGFDLAGGLQALTGKG